MSRSDGIGGTATVLPEQEVLWDGRPLQMVALADSCPRSPAPEAPAGMLSAVVASRVARATGRPVRVTSRALPGAGTRDLPTEQAQASGERPDVVLLLVSARDGTCLTRGPVPVPEGGTVFVGGLPDRCAPGAGPSATGCGPVADALAAAVTAWVEAEAGRDGAPTEAG